jgi:hypothetical protein
MSSAVAPKLPLITPYSSPKMAAEPAAPKKEEIKLPKISESIGEPAKNLLPEFAAAGYGNANANANANANNANANNANNAIPKATMPGAIEMGMTDDEYSDYLQAREDDYKAFKEEMRERERWR